MDPIAMLFSSFLTSVSSSIEDHMTDRLGTQLQAEVVEYEGHQVDYQYQLWKIRPNTVCASSKDQMIDHYSSCTQAAKSMFRETCNYLQQNPKNNWKYTRLKNMYCTAGASYTPTVASIGRPTEQEAELWDAKQKCSLLTLEARNSGLPATEKKRKAACDSYQSLKDGTPPH